MSIRHFITGALMLISLSVAAQRRVAADMEVKTVYGGKVATVAGQVYCTSSGNLTKVFDSPYLYYTFTNPSGEFKVYVPGTREVYSDRRDDFSDRDDLLYLFLSGRSDDMGLGLYGYKLSSTVREEDGLVKRTYLPAVQGRGVSKVELVLERFLPIYLAYYDASGALLSRTYLSSYARFERLSLPLRVTEVNYTSKKDSSIVRTIYSNVRFDTDDPMFDFVIPSDARPVTLLPK